MEERVEKEGITLEVETQGQIYKTINLLLPPPHASLPLFSFSRVVLCIYFINPALLSFPVARSDSISPSISFTLHLLSLLHLH